MPAGRNEFGRIATDLPAKLRAAVLYTAGRIASEASARSRVDTGKLKSGWHVTDGVRYGSGAGGHENPGATVYNTQDYAIHHEFGTSRGITPQPMVRPAIDAVRNTFEAMIEQAMQP